MTKAIESGGPLSAPAGPERRTGMVSLRVGECRVEPDLDRISGPAGETQVEPKTMAVLVYLARRPGKVVGADELIDAVWLGRPMGDNPVYRCIAQVRRALGDDPRAPTYIATVPRKGYRLIAPVAHIASVIPGRPPGEPAPAAVDVPAATSPRWPGRGLQLVLLAVLLVLAVVLWIERIGVPGMPPDPARVTLAVLPFENLAADPEHEYVAAGLSEAILDRLSTFPGLRVIARTSSFAFAHSGYDLPRIGELLGVEYLLQGSVRLENAQLRISTALIDRSGFQVWGDTFVRESGAVFALQDEIAAAVATRIAPQTAPSALAGRQPDFEAYQNFVIGRELLVRRPVNFRRLARGRLDHAVELDPGFAEAYAERAIALIFDAYSLPDREPSLTQARRDIDTALALNPDMAQAHAAQGFMLQAREPTDYVASEAPLRRALALDPNLVNAWNWLNRALRAQGRHAEADEALENAARIDPLSPTIGANLAGKEAARGRFEAAEQRLLRLLEVPQPAPMIHVSLIGLYHDTGRLSEALAAARRQALLSAEHDSSVEDFGRLAGIYATLGAWARVDDWQARAERESPDPGMARLQRVGTGLLAGYPGYAAAAADFRETLAASGLELPEVTFHLRLVYGSLLALAGDYRPARETLEAVLDPGVASQEIETTQETNARHALAWAWRHSGDGGRADALLALLDGHFRQQYSDGRLHRSSELFDYARTQALLGETTLALDLLEQAEAAGWRGYYGVLNDPRWNAVRGEPRFQALMARVEAELDAQLAEVERLEAQDDFGARLEAAIAVRRVGQGRP